MHDMQVVLQEDVLIARFSQNMNLDLDAAKQLVAERLKMQNGKTYPMIVHLNGFMVFSKSVRSYMATVGIEGISRGAFIAVSLQERVFLNFFLLVDAPRIPTKVFTKEADAIKWIRQETVKNN